MAEINVDPADLPEDERGSFDLIPDCEPLAHIISDEYTKKEPGVRERIVFCWEIIDGPHAKRRIWDGQNLINPSEQSQTIAKRAIVSMANAVGVPLPVKNSEDLHFKPMRIKVRTEPGSGDFGPKNVIKGYASASGQAVGAAGSATAPTPPAGGPASTPWGKKAA